MLYLLLQSSPNQNWILYVIVAAMIGYMVIRPLMRKKKDPLEKSPVTSSLAQQRSVERQMQNILVELSEMSRQITAQLDTRAAKLELLIKDADERIAKLQAGVPLSDAPSAPRPPTEPVVDPRYAEVYSLADQGRSATEIAAALNQPYGEIDLILKLRR
jgi:hypothetical protein